MSYSALGLVEVLGEANAVIVTDHMLKLSEVTYITQDTKCGGHALVFVGGDVAAVSAAIDHIRTAPPCRIFASAVISNPSEEALHIIEGFRARRGGR